MKPPTPKSRQEDKMTMDENKRQKITNSLQFIVGKTQSTKKERQETSIKDFI